MSEQNSADDSRQPPSRSAEDAIPACRTRRSKNAGSSDKVRIVLITTPTRTRKVNFMIPNGIIALAAYMEQCGHEVRIVDAALLREAYEDIARRVVEFEPDMVGVGGIITAYAYIIGLTAELRRVMPDVPIILGGPVVINNVRNCFTHMAIDHVVHGYGEIVQETGCGTRLFRNGTYQCHRPHPSPISTKEPPALWKGFLPSLSNCHG